MKCAECGSATQLRETGRMRTSRNVTPSGDLDTVEDQEWLEPPEDEVVCLKDFTHKTGLDYDTDKGTVYQTVFTVKVPKAEVERIQKVLDIDSFHRKPGDEDGDDSDEDFYPEIKKDTILYDHDVRVDKGLVVSIQVCVGKNNAWVGSTLFKDGVQVEDTEADDSFLSVFEYTFEGRDYSIYLEEES